MVLSLAWPLVLLVKVNTNDAVVYTHVKYEDGQHKWYQECDGKSSPDPNLLHH